MEGIEINDYFNNIENLTFKGLFENLNSIFDVYDHLKSYVEDEVKKNKEENKKPDVEVNDYVIVGNDVIIGEGTKIDSFTKIEGPCIIGKNVNISTNVYIRPYTIIGDNVTIGHGSEIKASVIMNNAKVATNVFVGDSIIGTRARLGSGTITANRRFDQSNIIIKNNGKREKLNIYFMGVILGDCARLGANVTTLPGTLIGEYTYVLPGTQVNGVIKKDKIVSYERTSSKERTELHD